jgi:hypothetical protein
VPFLPAGGGCSISDSAIIETYKRAAPCTAAILQAWHYASFAEPAQ